MYEFLDVKAGSDGRIVFFTTSRQLVAADTDGKTDVYASIPNAPPRCDGAEPTTSLLWPANRKFRTIGIGQVTDPEDDPVTVEITDVTQDEPVAGGSDAERAGDGQVRLRAERDARGDGRVYRIAFVATDSEGGSCTGVVKVTVPRHHRNPAVDSAPPGYDSLGA